MLGAEINTKGNDMFPFIRANGLPLIAYRMPPKSILRGLRGLDIVGADVVELNPARDRDGFTAMVAAKLVKEIASRMIETAG